MSDCKVVNPDGDLLTYKGEAEMAKDPEITVWEGRPSNLAIIGTYLKYAFITMILGGLTLYLFVIEPEVFPSDSRTLFGYLFAGLFGLIFVRMFWIVLTLKSTKWTLTTERFIYSVGVLSRRTENMELYRVQDLTLYEPFFFRIFGYGFTILITTDKTDPTLSIGPVKNSKKLYEMFREHSERQRELHHLRISEPLD